MPTRKREPDRAPTAPHTTPAADHDTRTGSLRAVLLPPTPPVRSPRAAAVVRWFGLRGAVKCRTDATREPHSLALDLAARTITLVTGPSGAGKSSLLRAVQCDQRERGASGQMAPMWIDLAAIALPDVPIVDCFHDDVAASGDSALRRALLDLARVGLGEAWTYLRTPGELSDGQRWRLRLAIALDRAARAAAARADARAVLVADEFAALLDRVTACVVARSLRRAIDAHPRVAALVATSHHDLTRALAPDVVVHCDFGRVTTCKTPTIPHDAPCKAADVIGGIPVPRAPRAAPVDRIGGFTRRSAPGGPMRKIIVTSLVAATSLAFSTTSLRAADNDVRTRAPLIDPRGGNDRLLLAPPSPFEPQRSLFQLDPRQPRRDALYPSVERELDRGTGRIESDADFETRRWQREQDAGLGLTRPQGEFDRFDEERDRTLRLETQQRRADIAVRSQQLRESESQRLAAERERFYRSAGIDATGAAHDSRQLRNLERTYQRDIKQLRRDRSAELNRLEKRDDLKGEPLRAARAAIDERYRAAQAERRERYSSDRARVMGTD